MNHIVFSRYSSESKPRILFVSYTADWTGPTNSLLLLLKYLQYRYNVAVLLPGQGLFSTALANEQIPFISFPSLALPSIPDMVRLIKREKFDLVYGNNASGSSRNALITAKIAGVPFICHIREMSWGKSWRQRGYLRFANAVIAVSQACANSLTPKFVPQHKLHVIYNGVILSSMEESRETARRYLLAETGLTEDSFAITSMAHVCQRKGQAYAVEVMAELVKQFPLAHLLLIGSLDRDLPYVDKIRTMIREMKLEQHVTLLGFRKDTAQLLQGSDLFLHTAMADPHPRSVVEGMAAGLPVVAFAIDGVAETVVEGHTGYLVDSGDISGMSQKISALAAAPSFRDRMGREGRHRVETFFSAKVTAEKVTRVIENQLLKVNEKQTAPSY